MIDDDGPHECHQQKSDSRSLDDVNDDPVLTGFARSSAQHIGYPSASYGAADLQNSANQSNKAQKTRVEYLSRGGGNYHKSIHPIILTC